MSDTQGMEAALSTAPFQKSRDRSDSRRAVPPSTIPRRPRKATLQLHDVKDVQAFVHATITKWEHANRAKNSNFRLTHDERDELVAEGLLIMVRLADRYQPRLPGYKTDGTFSGYAAAFLPRKLGDAWHRLQPNHHYVTVTGASGNRKRKWTYGTRPISIERLHEKDMDHDEAADRAAARFLDPRYWVPDAAAA